MTSLITNIIVVAFVTKVTSVYMVDVVTLVLWLPWLLMLPLIFRLPWLPWLPELQTFLQLPLIPWLPRLPKLPVFIGCRGYVDMLEVSVINLYYSVQHNYLSSVENSCVFQF
jgi:hypothetical protein